MPKLYETRTVRSPISDEKYIIEIAIERIVFW